jgi:hypothetical protein
MGQEEDDLNGSAQVGILEMWGGGIMSPELKECEATALRLPVAERAALAEHLIESLDLLDDAENESLWVEEAERRYQAYKQGSLSARPAAEVVRDARARIR